ncbi:chloride channel protein [Burkholderia sp. Leaf177]|uniref:chloride channel protein n=1 Tax=Burkholderia sp. Leaf177 TaxID=1736287 RepID=UPI0007014EFE|nr:chloride channel protein [Burkholderia sp. Leaf177]KQR73815.1 chloride channel protein [Burkholderia sp. Leaf177]
MSIPPSRPAPSMPLFRLAVVTVLTGIGAGLGGMALALLLHLIQHFAYGYSLTHLVGHESFYEGVAAASAERRIGVLLACGVIAGFGWLAIYRYGRPLVSIKKAISSGDPLMPPATTTAHALLQIITVALGSPLGREVAPREIGSLIAGWLSRYAGLSVEQTRLMVACGAGAGLAAVYNVPFGGAIFVLEVLLRSFELRVVIPALVSSVIAAVVAWLGLGDESQYIVPHFALSANLVAWSIVMGPVFGVAAFAFVQLTSRARAAAPKGWTLPVLSIANFLVIGLLAVSFPQILGNGKTPAQLGFSNELTIGLAATLLLIKVAITVSSLRAGAQGGLLTPGMSNGALLAIVLGGAWTLMWPGTPIGAFALVGATAFLASSMNMPITALVLMVEFTRVDHDFLVPMLCAVAGSIAVNRLLETKMKTRTKTAPMLGANAEGA